MISYSHFMILFEGKASDLRGKYPHISQLSDKHIVKYGEALGKMPDLPTDTSKVASVLSSFDTHGSKLEQKDFHRYGSFGSVEQSLRPHLEKVEKSKKIENASPVVFKGKTTTVRRIDTHEAASSGPHCKNTKWCVTAADARGVQHWNHYSRGGNKMYVIHTPEGKYAHHEGESGIARDATDAAVPLENIVNKHPELKQSEELRQSKYGHVFGNPELSDRFLKQIEDFPYDQMDVARQYPEHGGHFLNNPDPLVRSVVAEYPKHAGKLINDRSSIVRREVAKHPEHAGKLINDPNYDVRSEVAKHPEHAGKLVNDPEPQVRYHVAKHPEHAGKLVNDPIPLVADRAKKTLKADEDLNNLYKELLAGGYE